MECQIKKKLALLLPAHNEELIIQSSILSAIRAGLNPADIYIVDDASYDETPYKADELIPDINILRIDHSGKAGAVYKAIIYFNIPDRYEWIHVADADSIFAKDYFRIYSQYLSNKYVATVGFVQSLRGNWLCSYRAFSYTYNQHIIKRVQAALGMITVMPGPVTSYRTDIIKDLDFFTGSLTEDFDLTLQIHRKKLGKIKYIPEAVNYTQDPRTIKDFYDQTQRWYRGFFQGIKRYNIGLSIHRIDLSVLILLGDLLLFLIQVCISSYILLFATEKIIYLQQFIILDFSVLVFLVFYVAIVTKRPRTLLTLFYYYFLKTFELLIYLKAFTEVIVLRKKFGSKKTGWSVGERRYAVSMEALADTI